MKGSPFTPSPLTSTFRWPTCTAVEEAEAANTEADAAARATASKAAAAAALVRDAHLSMRDAGEVLGLSHQRVQQLLAS